MATPGRGGARGSRREEMLTSVVFAVVADHEHHLPLKHVAVVDEAARDPGNVLAHLHLFELAPEQGRGG